MGLLSSHNIGLIHAVNSTVLLAFSHFAAQIALQSDKTLSTLEVTLIRSVEELIFLTPIIFIMKSQVLFGSDKWLHLFFMSLTGFGSFIIMYYALELIPVSIALSLSGMCPFFAAIFSWIILKEKCACLDTICGVVSFFGVLLIARPVAIFGKYGKKEKAFFQNVSQSAYELIYVSGCGLALLFGATRAVFLVLTRKWGRESTETRSLIPVMYPSVFGVFVTPMIMLFSNQKLTLPKSLYGSISLFSVGILSSLGLISLSMALKLQNATVVGVIRNLEIVWTFIAQFFLLNIVPSSWSLGGASLIAATTIVAAFREKLIDKCNCKKSEEYKKCDDDERTALNGHAKKDFH